MIDIIKMIHVIQGDITKVEADAIVNAANSSLLGGSGVDGAIHKVGGKSILEECEKIRCKQGGCKVGEAVITTGGNLPAKFVIHTVGPFWSGGNKNEAELLYASYKNSFQLAIKNNVKSLAFPNISTGIYNFPKALAAEIAIKTVLESLEKDNNIEKIIFVCYDSENYNIYRLLLEKIIKNGVHSILNEASRL